MAVLAAVSSLRAPGLARGQRALPEKPLIMAFTPSRDPTALQEAADRFVAAVARLSGVPMRAQVASDYAGVGATLPPYPALFNRPVT